MPSPVCGTLIDLDLLHFTADEVRSLNEMVVTAVLEAPELSLFHTFFTGIKNDKRIGIVPGTFGLVGKAGQGCDPVADCATLAATEKTWEPRYVEIVLDQCVDTDFMNSLMRFAVSCGIDMHDLTKTEVFAFILNILSSDIKKMLLRKAWFDQRDAAQWPAGMITPGQDPAYFNVLNGFFYQLAEIYAADPERITAMSGNTQATTALQKSVATPALIYADLNAVIDAAKAELTAQPDRVLLVTQSVATRVFRHLQSLGVAYKIELMTNGLQSSTWDGINMYSIPLWDQWIAAYENNGTKLNNPHRVVYTTKSNLGIGMACTSLFERINTFYDPRSRYNRIEAKDAFDAKIFDDNLVQVGI